MSDAAAVAAADDADAAGASEPSAPADAAPGRAAPGGSAGDFGRGPASPADAAPSGAAAHPALGSRAGHAVDVSPAADVAGGPVPGPGDRSGGRDAARGRRSVAEQGPQRLCPPAAEGHLGPEPGLHAGGVAGTGASHGYDLGGEPDPGAPTGAEVAAVVDAAVARLELARKVRLLSGAATFRLPAEPAIGLRAVVFSDGPAGVRGERWDERDTSLALPSPTALAASWNEELVAELGALLAAEARRKGVDVLLAPTLNLHRSPRAGRHFECFSEDPLLTARTGAAYIRGVQSGGVAATAKHYVANDSETERLTLDARVDERTLHEVYLAPFEAAVRAGVWTVMSAYNRVNGVTMSESPLLDEPLKGTWGFDGAVVSDWGAVRSTEAAARAGQDLAMPGPHPLWEAPLIDAVRAGRVPEAAVDGKLRRLLLLAARVGALDVQRADTLDVPRPGAGAAPRVRPAAPVHAAPPADAALPVSAPRPACAAPRTRPDLPAGDRPAAPAVPTAPGDPRDLLRRAVAAGCVLLRNEADLLPLRPAAAPKTRPWRLAVVGPNAAAARVQGGGSAGVFPAEVVSPLDGIREALRDGGVEVVHAAGVLLTTRPTPVHTGNARNPRDRRPGVLVRYLSADGSEVHAEHRLSGRVLEPGDAPHAAAAAAAVEVSALVTADTAGEWRFSVVGLDTVTLRADGETIVHDFVPPESADPTYVHVAPSFRTAVRKVAAGDEVLLVAVRRWQDGHGHAVALAADPPHPDEDDLLARAVAAARGADAAVVVVGTTDEIESEGFDRASLALPGRQDELVAAVAAANPRTVVVVNSGGPVELPWRESAPAVLLGWFPGQEAGHGLADVLFGHAEPGGRLPTTWPDRAQGAPLPSTDPAGGVLAYAEGPYLGHRAWRRAGAEPAYWFGHGLGYTTWEYEDLDVVPDSAGGGVLARVRVRNTGSRTGREVAQVYLTTGPDGYDDGGLRLAGFAAVTADPGEAAVVEVAVAARALHRWSPEERRWTDRPGPYTLHAGPSAARPPLSRPFTR